MSITISSDKFKLIPDASSLFWIVQKRFRISTKAVGNTPLFSATKLIGHRCLASTFSGYWYVLPLCKTIFLLKERPCKLLQVWGLIGVNPAIKFGFKTVWEIWYVSGGSKSKSFLNSRVFIGYIKVSGAFKKLFDMLTTSIYSIIWSFGLPLVCLLADHDQ